MRCIAIDDEANALKVIELYAAKVEKLDLLASFTNPVKAADYLENHAVDLIFLDINMQSLNGFELLESLTHQPLIIFTTAYSEFAVKSYAVDAIDYLMKPISFSRFLKAINKADGYMQSENRQKGEKLVSEEKIISIKSGTTIYRINLDEILYLEADGNYTRFVTRTKMVMVLCTMKEALAKVEGQLIQTHRSFAVAISKVNRVEGHELMIGEKVIPISSSFRKGFLALFT